jgi:hypothetical protein
MPTVLGTFRTAAWSALTSRLAGPIAAGVAVALAVTLGMARLELAHARRQAQAAEAAVTAPVTGWAARLATCQGNGRSLQAALDGQNAAVAALKRDSAARVAASTKAASAARKTAQAAQAHAAAILAARPTSADACAAADALILKEAG